MWKMPRWTVPTDKDGSKTAALEIARTARGRFAPGNRGGPGRPRRGQSLAEHVRARFPVERLVQLAEDLAEHGEPDTVRMQALEFLATRGHGKPVDRHEIAAVGQHDDDDDGDLDHLSLDELRQLAALEEQRERLLAVARARALPPHGGLADLHPNDAITEDSDGTFDVETAATPSGTP